MNRPTTSSLATVAGAIALAATSVSSHAGLRDGWPQVFFDDFRYIDNSRWKNHNEADFAAPGKSQFHPSNATVIQDGADHQGDRRSLQIWNKWEPRNGGGSRSSKWEGAMLSSKRFRIVDGGDIEARLRLSGRGYERNSLIWPSWWTVNTRNGQEADIMEKWHPIWFNTSWHTSRTRKASWSSNRHVATKLFHDPRPGKRMQPGFSPNSHHILAQYHNYGVLMTHKGSQRLTFHIDGKVLHSVNRHLWYHTPMVLRFSSTPHADRLGQIPAQAKRNVGYLPSLLVDWVRVRFKWNGT